MTGLSVLCRGTGSNKNIGRYHSDRESKVIDVARTVMLIPLEVGVGVACVALGIFRAMERHGVSVNFYKPVAQPKPGSPVLSRSVEIVRRANRVEPKVFVARSQIVVEHAVDRFD